MQVITLIDYGIGNIFNVKRAFERCGATVEISSDPKAIDKAGFLVLPGVGAFDAGMKGLAERGLIEPLIRYAQSGKTLLGICLGMQLLFDESTEFGLHQGLGIIPGKILPLKPTDKEGQALKVPHIGWSKLQILGAKDDAILHVVSKEPRCYFVHSYTAFPTYATHRLADTFYGNAQIAAIVKKDNVYGCQFHPEKSGPVGLEMLLGLLEHSS